MKTRYLLSVLLLALFLFPGCMEEEVEPPVLDGKLLHDENIFPPYNADLEARPPIPGGQLVQDQITSAALEGNAIGDPATRNVLVYLPPGYVESGNVYPVVYLLHGMPLGERSLTSREGWETLEEQWVGKVFAEGADFPGNGFAAWVDDLIRTGEMVEMIIVMPDATSKYGLSFYANSELLGNYEDYIFRDLVNYIDANYRTIPAAPARAVMGHCQGGNGALRLAIKHPDVFGTVAALSPFMMLRPYLEASIPQLIAESPYGMKGPRPDKFFTSAFYGMAAAWSPNLSRMPYFVDLPFTYTPKTYAETQREGADNVREEYLRNIKHPKPMPVSPQPGGNRVVSEDLPDVIISEPLPQEPRPDNEVQYREALLIPSPDRDFRIVEDVWNRWAAQDPFGLLFSHGTNLPLLKGVYFDCGDQDELMTYLTNVPFHEALQSAGVAHSFELYPGRHLNRIYERYERAFGFASEVFSGGTH